MSGQTWHEKNIAVYDRSARELAEYFTGVGSRIYDIEKGLELANNPKAARVVEIGCGDGRDAEEIVRRVGWYEGFDPSKGLLTIAQEKVPSGSFECADALNYTYPDNLDVVYSFASLLHSPIDELGQVMKKVYGALKPGGIFYLSLKERAEYEQAVKKDVYGERLFYYYTPKNISDVGAGLFDTVFEQHQTVGSTDWFTIALRKKKS